VAEVVVDHAVVGEGAQGSLNRAILEATEEQLGSLDEIANHIIFCIPTGSLIQGSTAWMAYTYLYEPVSVDVLALPRMNCGPCVATPSTNTSAFSLSPQYSYYQKSRCTRLSVVMHEMGHSLGFRHSGLHGNGYGKSMVQSHWYRNVNALSEYLTPHIILST